MSQFFIGLTDGGLPPDVPTSFVADTGTAIPAAHVLNVKGSSTTTSNDNGIDTIANPNSSNNLYVRLTNRLEGSATSTNGATANIVTFALQSGSAAVYRFSFDVSGRDTVSGDGVGYSVDATFRTDGSAATVISAPYVDDDEDASLIAASITMIASSNNAILQATGVATKTIVYKAVGTYVVI